MRRYARRRDACEPLIVTALRRRGFAVQLNSGDGEPDLTVSSRTSMLYLECKDFDPDERTRPVRRNDDGELPACLTPVQVRWWRAWIEAGGRPPVIVMTVEEALAAAKTIDTTCGPSSRSCA